MTNVFTMTDEGITKLVEFLDAFEHEYSMINRYTSFGDILKNVTWLKRMSRLLDYFHVQYMIYRLWSPGIFTIKEVINETGVYEERIKRTLRELIKLDVIEKKLTGIYMPGPTANMAMCLFAWLALNKSEV